MRIPGGTHYHIVSFHPQSFPVSPFICVRPVASCFTNIIKNAGNQAAHFLHVPGAGFCHMSGHF